MNQFKALAIFSMSVFLYSCSTNSTDGTERNNSENLTAVTPTDVVVAEAAAILVKDPRKIGPDKPFSQKQIEHNIYQINASENPIFGYWVGSFGKNKINIALASIERDSIFGHSVCARNFRPIKGTVNESAPGVYKITMSEPGDEQYDGAFEFTIDIDKKELVGNWSPFKPTVGAKKYTLHKRDFKYDPSVGDFPVASKNYLDVPEVENLLPEQIEMIRNEIYARHGYSFTNLKIRRIFDAKEWYIPMGVDIRDQLTEIEAQNIDLLYNYEEYYDEYYNDFGR